MNQQIIMDVRSPQEFASYHLEGAVNIPLDRLAQEPGAVAGVDKSREILVYCHSGMRSAAACSILSQLGFEHVSNGGAMAVLLMNFKGTTS